MHPRIKQWTVLLLLSTFLFCSTISNAALPVAVPVARAIVSHPYVKERAIKLILAMGGTYAISLLRHKDNKTSVYDINCVIDGIVDTGPTVQEIEQSVRKNHPYVKVWFAHRSGKYNVYHLDYGPSEKNVYKHTDITCSGPNQNDYKDIIIDSQKAAELFTNQANQGNTEAKNFVKDALKADNPNLTATQIEQLIKGATTTTPPKPVTQPKPPTTTTQPKPPVVTTPAKPANPPKPVSSTKPVAPTQPIVRKKSQAQCNKEWDEATEMCEKLIGSGNTGITGGYTNPYQCAKGLVSQECGGNKVK